MKTIFVLTSRQHVCSEMPTGSFHSLISGLKLNGVKISVTGTCKLLGGSDEVVKKEDIIAAGKRADLIILMFVNIPQTKSCEEILQEPYLSKAFAIDRWDRTVFIDYYERTWRNVHDENQPAHHLLLTEKCKRYFKRELSPFHKKWYVSMLPYPLSYFPSGPIPPPEKEYDIFCSFPQILTGLRRGVVRLCEKMKMERPELKVVVKNDCSHEEYINCIRASWITLDARGAGCVNNRFLEIISNRSLCFREKYDIIFYKDYTAGEMLHEYGSVDELEMKLEEALGNKDKIRAMEAAAYEHYNKFHTAEKVVEYLLEESFS